MTFLEALELIKTDVAEGFILDYYVTDNSIIAITDQGEYVFFRKKESCLGEPK